VIRTMLAGAVLFCAACSSPVSAQEGWPWSEFRKRPPPVKKSRRQPTPRFPKATSPRSPHEKSPSHHQGDVTPSAHAGWRILRTVWTTLDEAGYEEFVRRIGDSRCRTMHDCLTSATSNPLYHATNPDGAVFYADCADLPYMLRAYFAWKNGLPFSYATEVKPLGRTRDIRYTARGNRVIARRDIVGTSAAAMALAKMVGTISSAYYRCPPKSNGPILPDLYPVTITRESIKPGTIIYDANGHVAVVYKVTQEGRIHYFDSHPDNSISRSVYGKAFARASPAMGAGFKRWRPQKLVGATKRPDGSYEGGHIVLDGDDKISDWSDEQFYGTETNPRKAWRAAKFVFKGQVLGFHEFVRKRLARAGFKYDPVMETRTMVRSLCNDLRYRVDAVNLAIRSGIHLRSQPDQLPGNIYGAVGDWEFYSTPSRDARLKTAFKELRDEVVHFLSLEAQGGKDLAYRGDNLRQDLWDAYSKEAQACAITYQRSDGSKQTLSFEEIRGRLFKLSFDPYHCIERRWGADQAKELSTCRDGPRKRRWYAAEQRLRNQLDRTYDVVMGFSLSELERKVPGSGVDAPPDVDVWRLLNKSTSQEQR
jgi:hypothetical protein